MDGNWSHAPHVMVPEDMIPTTLRDVVVVMEQARFEKWDPRRSKSKNNFKMKAVAKIADDRNPAGWEETFKYPSAEDEGQARQMLDDTIRKFNSTLRSHEIPRRLLSVSFTELTADECQEMGFYAYPDKECPIPEAKTELRHAWNRGWDLAEKNGQFEDSDDDE